MMDILRSTITLDILLLSREFEKQWRLRQLKRHLKIRIDAVVSILRLLLLSRILYIVLTTLNYKQREITNLNVLENTRAYSSVTKICNSPSLLKERNCVTLFLCLLRGLRTTLFERYLVVEIGRLARRQIYNQSYVCSYRLVPLRKESSARPRKYTTSLKARFSLTSLRWRKGIEKLKTRTFFVSVFAPLCIRSLHISTFFVLTAKWMGASPFSCEKKK